MLLTPELQHRLKTYIRSERVTYEDVARKLRDPETGHEPAPSTIGRWVHGDVRFIQDPLAHRLLDLIGLRVDEQSQAIGMGLSAPTIDMAQTIEFLPLSSRRRVQDFLRDELRRYMADVNRANAAAV